MTTPHQGFGGVTVPDTSPHQVFWEETHWSPHHTGVLVGEKIPGQTGPVHRGHPLTSPVESWLTPVFKEDDNLDFNIGKTKVLDTGPTADHVFELVKHFLDTDPDLTGNVHHFTRDMFTTEGIEVLGTPVGIDRYIQTFLLCPETVSKSWKMSEKCNSHRWFCSHPTVEILRKHTHTIHQRKH